LDLRTLHVGASGRSPIMGVRQDAPTIETIISKTSYEIIKLDDFVKSLLERHPGESRGPEHLEITGFRLSPE
jgi:hypothetical protein